MTIQVGDRVPSATLRVMTQEGPSSVTTTELLGSGKVVLFSVPGAFTPTCSKRHLPGFIEHAPALAGKGVDRIVCIAVNDVFVMDAWGKSAGVGDRIVMAADGSGDFTRALGLELDLSDAGMGQRGKRFAMVIQDGVVQSLDVEPPGEFGVSSAENVHCHL